MATILFFNNERYIRLEHRTFNITNEYTKVFNGNSHHYFKNAGLDLYFLKRTEKYANDILDVQGHLFLNEVFDMLGLPRTTIGAIVGWNKGPVNFGLPEKITKKLIEKPEFVLNFNVDGVIFDTIES
jgi:hypothetical protein